MKQTGTKTTLTKRNGKVIKNKCEFIQFSKSEKEKHIESFAI